MSFIAANEAVPLRRQLWADGLLAVVTLIWGSTFVLVKDVVEQVPVLPFLATRFAIGAGVLFVAVLLLNRWRGLTMRELLWGTITGVALGVGYALQTLGLQDESTSASKAGFITGLSVVIVPVLSFLVLRQRLGKWTVAGVVLATAGLALLSLRLDEGTRVTGGDLLVLGCAVAFAIHILLVAHASGWANPLRITAVQVTVAGLLCALGAAGMGHRLPNMSEGVLASAAFLGVAATAVAFLVQVSVQRFTTAAHTALIFTLEPVFAAIFGIWLHNDVLGINGWVGAGLILTSMLVTELLPYMVRRNAAT
ncbi:MAG: DMT family transporter [Chloroflexota bacterium]|nr:DMT family transporter [Chloroflexota bacterium]MDQ5865197.1 DMT family transporter [Chloroflexota bacterium]